MNNTKKLLSTSFFVIAFTVSVIGQPPPSAKPDGNKDDNAVRMYQQPSLANLPAAEKFSSADGRFTISLPVNISGFSALTPKIVGENVSGSQYQWQVKEGIVLASYLDFMDEDFIIKTEQDYVNYFAGAAEGVLNSLNAKPLDSSKIRLGNHKGIKVNFQLPNGKKGTYRNYIVGKRQYALTAVFADDVPNAEKLINRAFDTLALISQTAVDEELQRKIAQATPPPLPQEPVAAKEKTDAEDENLKGKVKSVTQEDEDLSGTWSVQGRHLSSITDFNEKGNRIKRLSYDSKGLPFEVTVFGYIDGARVRNSETVRFDSNPPLMAMGIGKKEERKRDPRYDYKHTYKYVNGKLAEETWIRNDGSMWIRYVYNYKNNQMEELVYDENGKLNQKYLYVLDGKGNEVERTSVDVLGIRTEGDSKYNLKYDSFDEKGNWTKQTTLKLVTENGKQVYKPSSVTYRTITYYP